MSHTTAALVRRMVQRAVEGVLDRCAVGNTTKETELYIAKLRLTAAQLRQEADEIDELADQENVGRPLRYDTNRSVHRIKAKAYRLAAEQGVDRAQNNLSVMYGTGRGVREDYVLAHMWANIAAANGNEKYPS